MGWIAYAAAWLVASFFWMFAAVSAGMSMADAFPFGLLIMGFAGVMGVGVWRLTGRLPWDWRSPWFFAGHLAGAALFSIGYATSWMWPDILTGRIAEAIRALQASPIVVWNILLGCGIYLGVAGLSYAVRGQQRMRAQEAAAAEARLLAQQAQLAALRAQINPHFLFNALHSVGALVSRDPARADRALECLGDLLRYALGAEDQVPFRQEWRFIKDYLAFEQLRLADRLTIVEAIDDAALPVPVPPLILQPLVENAVRHGIADRPEGGRVVLAARVDGSHLILTVTDDGRGDGGKPGDGLGMGSVRRRLAALYGERASLDTGPVEDGFRVTVRLPIRDAENWDSAA